MPGRRTDHDRDHIGGKQKGFIERTVEQKVKLMFGMLPGNPFERLTGEPAYTVKFVFNQQSGIYGYLHSISGLSGNYYGGKINIMVNLRQISEF